MSDNYDQLALSWVRNEINNTLEQARQGLENFAEDSQDQTQIQFCINCLHQVQGTLQMLDFSGAARLALEMEKLAERMANDSQYAVDSAFEVLMRALLQMPGYLERVEEGHKDIPVILLPLLNQIREASNQPPILERELFSADTSGVAPPKASEVASESDKTSALQDNIKKLRAHFQKGLTGVIRGEKVKESLARIHKVLLRLEGLTEGHSVAKLWWVADGFIFSITEKGLYKKKEIHQLLAKVDKQIKRLSELGEEALSDVISDELLSQLLYFVARSNSKNNRVVSLKQEFNLADELADSDKIKQRQDRMAQPDTSAVTNVAGALDEELSSVKDQLDLFVRVQTKDPAQLQSLVDSLTRIADTLTLLELAIPRDVIRQQTRTIQNIIDSNKAPDDSIVMDIAGALLFVEANLKNINLEAASEVVDEEDASQRSQDQAKDAQVDEATQTLIKVARKSMQSAKDKIIGYIASGFESDSVSDVPSLLDEVIGGVKIVQFDTAADILQTAKTFVENNILNTSVQPKEEYLDALADVITSVEYYLEASEEGKYRGIDSILKGAEESLASLNSALEISTEESAEELPIDTQQETIVDDVSSEETILRDIPLDQPQASEEVEKPQEPATSIETTTVAVPSASKEIDETLIDDDVLEIFLEEAEEEIENLSQMLPRWINNAQDEEALTTLRRSFHTLKGSGRLVGALVIGEVSWAVENMLNKVIEETIPAETPVISVLNEVQLMLPRLVEAFSAKQEPKSDSGYQQLIAKAEHIAAGKPLSEFDFEHQSKEEQAAEAVESEVQDEAIDPVLLEIFSAEAESHLATISDYLSSAPADGTVAVTDDLIRALHTLKGSAKMANVGFMAGLTGPLEKYSRLVKGSGQRFEQSVIGLLKDSHQYLLESLNNLKSGNLIQLEREQELLETLASFKTDMGEVVESTDAQRDQGFVAIFLTEGLDILQQVAELNDKLKLDLNDQNIKETIKSELHAFYRGAEVVAIEELVALSQTVDGLATFALTSTSLNDEFNPILAEAVEKLTDMLNKIASEEDLEPPQTTIENIQQWIERSGLASAPEDMDVELVELFVEEGEELIESARELLVRWQDHLNSKEICTELRRIYHTVKGSSRMAGAMNIGDLGHAVEDMFNTVLDFGRNLNDIDHEITVGATNKLENMIAELKTLRWPEEATQNIQIIRQHLSPESVEETKDVVDAVEEDTLVVESELVTEVEVESETTDEIEEIELVDELKENLEPPVLEVIDVADNVKEIETDDVVEYELIENELPDSELLESELELEKTNLGEPESVDDIHPEATDFETTELESELTSDEEYEDSSDEFEFTAEIDVEPVIALEPAVEPEELEETIQAVETQIEAESDVDSPIAELSEQTSNVYQLDLDEDGEEVLEIYLEEAEELLIALDEALLLWSDNMTDKETIDSLQRNLHTFKGGARLSDLAALGDLTHEMETYFERVNSGLLNVKASDVDLILEGYDVIANLVKEVQQQKQLTRPVAYLAELDKLINGEGISETAEVQIAQEAEVEDVVVTSEEIIESTVEQPTETNLIDTELTETVSSDTIEPAAPIVVTGKSHKIELDEDGEEVLEIYLEEAEELLLALDEALHDWAADLTNKDPIDLLQRTLHTFKGGARLSDLVVLGDLTHEMETYFERVNSGRITAQSEHVEFLLLGYDVIAGLVKEVESERQMTVPEDYMAELQSLIKGEKIESPVPANIETESDDAEDADIEDAIEQAENELAAMAEVVSFEDKKQQVEVKQKQAKSTDIIRVPAEQLEELVNLAGETSIFRSRLEQQMSVLRYNLEEMNSTVDRLREQLRNLDIETDAQISYRKEISGGEEYEDFDPLEMDRYTRQQELTRGLSESAVDLLSLKESLDGMTADSETLLLQQGRVNTEMQESLMRTRMIPFESLVPRLRRMVRQISNELDKTIELTINADGEMDRSVLERLIAPLEHMLRNAMDHGIEPQQERIANNKSDTGRVKISLYRDGSEVFVKIQDDGRGLNLAAIRGKATERGLINENSDLSDHELQQLILEAGFSTAEKVTQISGRGVGMDVVSSEIKQMGGVIEIDSVEGQGSTFTIKLPFTVSVNHALMVQLGEDVFAIPLANIEGIVRVSPFELEEYYSDADSAFEYAGVDYSMYSLGQLLDHNKTPNLQGVTQPLPVLLLHGADHPTALQVDGLLGSREIVVKSIGNQLSSISGLSGATILGDGRVVFILDMPALIRRIDAIVTEDVTSGDLIEAQAEEERIPRIMVVDDSITVRKVTTRLLERNDYEVITAKDGVDALAVLGEHKPDVMLLDIEMPRMDGFELATIIRHDEKLKDLPIIMITSRTGDKHRERAEQIGVNQYMGKPFNEVDLLGAITTLLPIKD